MPKEVNPRIHVNERDYPIKDHHCDDPVKKKAERGRYRSLAR